jgi:hypothetical protein
MIKPFQAGGNKVGFSNPSIKTMRYEAFGKCRECGRQNEWSLSECPGCHIKRRPWLTLFAYFWLATLAVFGVLLGIT